MTRTTRSSMRARAICAMRFIVAVIVTTVTASCGLFDGLFYAATISDEELCDRAAKSEEVCGSNANIASCEELVCLRERRRQCPAEWQALVDCFIEKSDTEECPVDCTEVGQNMISCSGLPVDDLCAGFQVGCGNNNGVCDDFEGGGCPDCTGLPSCNNDFCDVDQGESVDNCPRDCGPGSRCNNNGVCELGNEDPGSCPNDCRCDNDALCEPGEDAGGFCGDCQGGCDNDGICAGRESASSCNDCNIGPCDRDEVCDVDEDPVRCGDCVALCFSDNECGLDEACDFFNQDACGQGQTTCSDELPRAPICQQQCGDGVCPADEVCVESRQGPDRRRVCEPTRCLLSGECTGGDLCIAPVTMNVNDGLCLRPCDPLGCAFGGGGGCACTQINLNRCGAFTDDASGDVVGFACSFSGDVNPGGACSLPSDCRGGLECFDGLCRQLCDPAHPCPGGDACLPLLADIGVCVDDGACNQGGDACNQNSECCSLNCVGLVCN